MPLPPWRNAPLSGADANATIASRLSRHSAGMRALLGDLAALTSSVTWRPPLAT